VRTLSPKVEVLVSAEAVPAFDLHCPLGALRELSA
jgi:hypothetical protein